LRKYDATLVVALLSRRSMTRRGNCDAMRISIKVRPGSGRTSVGGEHDGSLVVRVAARTVDGQATEAALAAVAAAFGVRRREVTLVSGSTSRTKVVDIDGGDPSVLDRLMIKQS